MFSRTRNHLAHLRLGQITGASTVRLWRFGSVEMLFDLKLNIAPKLAHRPNELILGNIVGVQDHLNIQYLVLSALAPISQ